jgi:hypothetical protein
MRAGDCTPSEAPSVSRIGGNSQGARPTVAHTEGYLFIGGSAACAGGRARHGASLPSSAARSVRSASESLSAASGCHHTGTSCQWQHWHPG